MMKIIDKPSLPKEVFQVQASPQLLAQAVRVYLANQRQGTQNAKTRAEVNRTRHKLYKQKGTGGARHGDKKAPIFVGGGVTFAPKPRDYSLTLPKQAKRKALFGALTVKSKDKNLFVVSGMDKLIGKTAELAKFLNNQTQEASDKRQDKRLVTSSWLIITDQVRENVYRAGRNIPGVTIIPASQVNAYQVLKADRVLVLEEVLDTIGRSQTKDMGSPSTSLRVNEKKEKKIGVRSEKREISVKKVTRKMTVKPRKATKKK